MPTDTAQVDDLRLVAVPSAVNCAEMFVRFTLVEWRLRAILDDAIAAANTLVTAAVNGDKRSMAIISVRLRLHSDRLAIEIEDEHGAQSLAVPDELAGDNSGVQTLSGGGRVLWHELALPSGTDATAVPLPQRGTTRRDTTKASAAPIPPDEAADPQVMERILEALSRPADDRPE